MRAPHGECGASGARVLQVVDREREHAEDQEEHQHGGARLREVEGGEAEEVEARQRIRPAELAVADVLDLEQREVEGQRDRE